MLGFLKEKASRLRKILIFSDLHATRITLATAELLVLNDVINHETLRSTTSFLSVFPSIVWICLLAPTALLQCFFIIRGYYHEPDAVFFAGWNAMLWIFMTAVIIVHEKMFPGLQLALTLSASWVFVRSGFPITGNRSSDHADRRRKHS